MNKTDKQNLSDALNWRYAVKKFEKREINTQELEDVVKEILQQTPTSFGLQAYKFVIVKNEETRKELQKFSWDQSQVTDADLYVVFTVPTNFDISFIEKHMKNMQNIRGLDDKITWAITDYMANKIIETWEEIWITNYEEWLTKQAYIALWNLMTWLSILGIDSCAIEGLLPKEYDRVLNLEEKSLTTKVAIAIGKRHPDDKYQNFKKVRFSTNDLFLEV